MTVERVSRAECWRIFLVALAIRLVFCFVAVPLLHLPTGPHSSEFYRSTDGYLDLAQNLWETGRFSFAPESPLSTYRAPGFPVLLAGLYPLVGDITLATILLNCFSSAITAVIAVLIASRIAGRLSWLARYAVAFWPHSIWYCASSFSDTFLTFAMALYLLSVIVMLEQPSAKSGLWSGVCLSAATLTKSILLPFAPVLLITAVFLGRRVWPAVLVSCLSAAVLISGWTVRNYQVSGALIPVSGGLGFNMLVGTYMIEEPEDCAVSFKHGVKRTLDHLDRVTGRRWEREELRPAGHLDVPLDVDKLCGKLALQMYREQPHLFSEKVAVNALRFWYFSSSPTKGIASGAINLPMLVLALMALYKYAVRAPRAVLAVCLFSLFLYASYCVIIVHSTRFAFPILFVLVPLAAQVVYERWAAINARLAGDDRPPMSDAESRQTGSCGSDGRAVRFACQDPASSEIRHPVAGSRGLATDSADSVVTPRRADG